MAFITSPYGRYVYSAVAANAAVYAYLLRDLGPGATQWDVRLEEGRFTLREVTAHLLDFDRVKRGRFERMLAEDNPNLPNWDEDEAARDYASRNPIEDLAQLQQSRLELAAWLEGLTEEQWQRRGHRPGVGSFSVMEGVALMLGHDAYHLKQISEWLAHLT